MRLEITPVYEVSIASRRSILEETKKLVSVRKRFYSDDGRLHAEFFLDWGTGEWCPTLEASWNTEINAEMRQRVGWVEERGEKPPRLVEVTIIDGDNSYTGPVPLESVEDAIPFIVGSR